MKFAKISRFNESTWIEATCTVEAVVTTTERLLISAHKSPYDLMRLPFCVS